MAYDNKKLKQNEFNEIVPQAYSPAIDDYEAVQSTHGGLHNVLYGPNGLPLSVVNNKLAVRATELEALMQGFSTDGKLEQVRQEIENSRNELALVKSELETIKANQISGDQKVQLSGNIVPVIGNSPISLASGEILSLAVDVRSLGTKFALSGRVGHTDVELTISFANSEASVANEYNCTFWQVLTVDSGLIIGENTPGTNKHIKVDPQVLDRVYGPWMGIHIKNVSSSQRAYNNWNLVIS